MIDKLQKSITNDNCKLVDSLVEFIINNKIKDILELKTAQENIFKIDNAILDDENKVKYCLDAIKHYPYDYDYLNFEEIQKYKKLMIEIKDDTTLMDKIKKLIIIYSMTNREIVFPYYAYNMILNKEL